MLKLTTLADRIARNAVLRHALFLVAALAAIFISGYHFGTFDQVIHIPFLKKFADPTLYPNDPFLDLRYEHYSYFWQLFIPAYRAGILEETMFVVHILATYGLFWMFWELTNTIFKNSLANLISVCLLVFPHMGMPGFQLVEFSLLNRTFVLPFVLGALILYLRRHYSWAFLILGIMFNIHIIYVSFALAFFLVDSLRRWREAGWRVLLKGLPLFLLGALPVLIWRLQVPGTDLQIRPDILRLIASALLAGVYYAFLPYAHVLINTVNGIGTFLLFLIGRRLNLSTYDREITNFIYAIGIILIVQLITTYWLPVVFILQLQILRVGFFLLVFGYVYFSGFLANRLQQGNINGFAGGLVVFGFVTFVSPIVPLLLLVLYNWISKKPWRQWFLSFTLALVYAVTVIAGLRSGLWSPGIHMYEPITTWTQTQDWARENTPKDAMFITPPQIFLHYIPDWRTFSERRTLATLVEIYMIPHPSYIPYWQERFEAIAPGAIDKFNSNYFDTLNTTRAAFYSLKPEDYLRVAQKYNVRYLVVEKPHLQPFNVVYQNEGFVVYDLQGK